MSEHEHEFDGSPKRNLVRICVDRNCRELRIGTGKRWRKLTADEYITVTAHMMEAISIAQAMQIIHGKERGLDRARQVLGYDE